ncbi:hypothetical protein [Coxiella endosymbiont of Ornithodoros maritimus]|uniref:hypothetical protein n=1 Tax=Coxiella endosymbiont of Ornithodoros maritimus TaxID=1656172 RepID=UPI00389926D9
MVCLSRYGVIGFRIVSTFVFLIGALLVLWRWSERVKERIQPIVVKAAEINHSCAYRKRSAISFC